MALTLSPIKIPRPSPAAARSLSAELDALYRDTRARMGVEDLEHIRRVADYSRAIDARARELIQRGSSPREVARGAVLRGLHTLLEFSELGHNILHGSYDDLEHLDPGGPFHSERWDWDFVTDPREWKVMHHQNHHPHTNIVGKDHDLGYSIARLLPGQSWYGHHAFQAAILGLFVAHAYPFAIYTATSAARVEGRSLRDWRTYRVAAQRIAQHVRRDYLEQPKAAGLKAVQTALGNYAGTAFGYDLALVILAIEHHAPNVELFADPGPDESRDAFFERQYRATTNFTDGGRLEGFFRRVLREEVEVENPPDFRVFYGGLDTHIEHHLFPDLPCQRQREIAPEVRRIAERWSIPYNELPLETLAKGFFKRFFSFSIPVGEEERAADVLRRPRTLLRRLRDGVSYRGDALRRSDAPYLRRTQYHDVQARVVEARLLAGGEALSVKLARPRGWEVIDWLPGAFISVRVRVAGEEHIRQYSLLREGAEADTLDITIKRVAGGVVSNHLANTLRAGDWLTLVGPPENTGGLAQRRVPQKALYLAGGVGITPILSMLRHHRRVAPNRSAVLLYFNRTREATLFADELRALAAASNVRCSWTGPKKRRRRRGCPRSCCDRRFRTSPSGKSSRVRRKGSCVRPSSTWRRSTCVPNAFTWSASRRRRLRSAR